MSNMTISGAISGLDTATIINQLVSLQANQQTLLKNQRSSEQKAADALGSLSKALSSVGSLATGAAALTTTAGAISAVTTLDSALKDVSTVRAKLGAFQNRFEHTINNLNVAVENLSASESRIRDTDMASEMVEFTKNQILSQAGTAMLAQANQAPQSVLKLLQ